MYHTLCDTLTPRDKDIRVAGWEGVHLSRRAFLISVALSPSRGGGKRRRTRRR